MTTKECLIIYLQVVKYSETKMEKDYITYVPSKSNAEDQLPRITHSSILVI